MKSDTLTLKISESDVKILMNILIFSKRAANIMSSQLLTNDRVSDATTIRDMANMSYNASSLHNMLTKHIQIGEPESDVPN